MKTLWSFAHLGLHLLLALLLLLAVDVVTADPVQAEPRRAPVLVAPCYDDDDDTVGKDDTVGNDENSSNEKLVAPLRLPVVRAGEPQLLK